MVIFAGISLATWKEHQVKKREKKKLSKEQEEKTQMEKETKSAVKDRGINGDSRIRALRKGWGSGKHRMQGFHGALVLQRTRGERHQTSEVWPQTTASVFIPALHSPTLCPRPHSTHPLDPYASSFPAPTLLQKVLPVLWHWVLFPTNQSRTGLKSPKDTLNS